MKKKIGIIGAGISGLLACKYAMQKGFNPMVFEARNCIGGVWCQTIESTKLQTPKKFYHFSDFAWPSSVKEHFPDHNQVMEYLQAYAVHFNILKRIKFNSRVTCIDFVTPSNEDMLSWNLWGGTGTAISPIGKWDITVQDVRDACAPVEVYQLDFVILCIGRYSDLPNIPNFPINKGPEVFGGQVLHSMDFAAMDNDCAAEFIENKRVTVIGFQKSAVDVAAEIASRNGVEHPCMLVFKTVHWTVPEHLLLLTFGGLTRFSELMVHKPGEGFFTWILATLLSPLLWIFSKLIECYLKWIYPLKKYNMIPAHGFLKQISSCMFTVLPDNFYGKVKEGSLILKKSESFCFNEKGLVIEGERSPMETDIVIFATGYKSDEKIKNIFKSNYFQNCITGSSAPFYRECIHPRIPQLAILGYADSPATLHTTEMRSKWLAHFLAGKFTLPTISEMEADVKKWEECMKYYAKESYRRSCISVLLQIHCNDQLCKDMGYNPIRKHCYLAELFSPYGPNDYKYLAYQ
ncbi:probable flavin-containing monooxygenase 1 [Ricinus communis]|uniref:Flavin-containing monooxygenase n=1 Tax=Ricinus communis TaxID=3988 RepID=B9R8M4_RICCO|nr:probable flavin-containing monooxygenase 1 [Ricinus communis]EEF52854.1 dimethylaniline monooxygenase, putative [Ricinus communis]|eukprot:XP_002510667.1 probable flavin-containing monooxygenase 1 [Ricinus communis]